MSTHTLSSGKPVRPYKGVAMEGVIARWYARNAGRASERKRLLETIKPFLPVNGSVLEVAPGPGLLAIDIALACPVRVTALEISKTFVGIAQDNARRADAQVEFRHGNASDMPFARETFNFIICVAAFKNFSQPLEALCEMHRVLKPGGRACIADLRRDVPLETIDDHIRNDLHMSGLNAVFTKWVFKTTLLRNAYAKAEIEELAARTDFARVRIDEDALGMNIWLEK